MGMQAWGLTAEEFKRWAPPDDTPGTFELINGLIVYSMAEGEDHVDVKTALIAELSRLIPSFGPCKPRADGALVRIDAATTLIPDASIWCKDSDGVLQPTVIFEVSASSLEKDMTFKRELYFRNPSVQNYMVVDVHDRRALTWLAGREAPTIAGDTVTLHLQETVPHLSKRALWANLG